MHYDAYLADMTGTMVVVEQPEPAILDPDSHDESRRLADAVRADGHRAIVYPSVRGPFTNIACLEPSIVQHIRRGKTVSLRWSGGAWTP